MCLILMVMCVGLQCVIVTISGHTHLLFVGILMVTYYCLLQIYFILLYDRLLFLADNDHANIIKGLKVRKPARIRNQ